MLCVCDHVRVYVFVRTCVCLGMCVPACVYVRASVFVSFSSFFVVVCDVSYCTGRYVRRDGEETNTLAVRAAHNRLEQLFDTNKCLFTTMALSFR